MTLRGPTDLHRGLRVASAISTEDIAFVFKAICAASGTVEMAMGTDMSRRMRRLNIC